MLDPKVRRETSPERHYRNLQAECSVLNADCWFYTARLRARPMRRTTAK
jgi:hypothetical protein